MVLGILALKNMIDRTDFPGVAVDGGRGPCRVVRCRVGDSWAPKGSIGVVKAMNIYSLPRCPEERDAESKYLFIFRWPF